MNSKIFLYIIILLVIFALGFFLSRITMTGLIVQQDNAADEYSWTKAICNENNECIDVMITCLNGNVQSIKPISNVVQHPKNWSDPRGTEANKLC